MTGATSATFPVTERAALRPSGWLRVALLAGVAAAAAALVFDLAVAERVVDRAVILEGEREHVGPATPELFSRGEQRGGLVVGLLLYGTGVAFVLAGAAVLLSRRIRLPRASTWLALAAAGTWAVVALPMVAYPPLPPGAASDLGIGTRQGLYVGVVALGLSAAAGAAAILGARRPSSAAWRRTLAAALLAASALVAAFLFPRQHAAAELPDDVLRDFRLVSLASQALFWSAFGATGYTLLRRGERT